MRLHFDRLSRFAFVCVLAAFVLGACGDQGTADPKVEAKRLESAKGMRSYFDSSNGDFTKLSTSDQAAYLSSFNNDRAAAKRAWEMMKYGPSGKPEGAPETQGF